ncbi:uncharacterized protein K441DRAFT_683796 [Cenococcum geophilum 1.58]|uniref:uncharacterized protein n=1 Tax=Cenococcum geophilum 1.58 TaxID=794803 RepID=UPI00358EDC6C|nr:hypothetical protein K441DRAFT_683796 [Cenococcum geophilum 1.58]
MHRHTRSEATEFTSPRSSRATSFSSDRPSAAGSTSFQIPTNVRPPPAYIAASVASQIVTDHHNAQLREEFDFNEDSSPFLINALFSDEALNLLNTFLDHLLFSFLSTARSPSLTTIRPAITDVLRPRLAREAMTTADEELQGLLAGDDEEFPGKNEQDPFEKWDVEMVWKRTRLRIMVYTRLGEFEDEDEERYLEQERALSLDDGSNEELGLVSWAAAIFLTSVIEYIAEQTLMVSGQAAFARMSAKMKKAARKSMDGEEVQLERVVVEEFDVEKVALNSTLGRLWRTWKKRVRVPTAPLPSPTPSRGQTRGFSNMASLDTAESALSGDASRAQSLAEVPKHEVTETDIAANIPLPMSDNDVAEIEVPGLARQFDEGSSSSETPTVRPSQRPASFILSSSQSLLDDTILRRSHRPRPSSMPIPGLTPFVFPSHTVVDDPDFVTPMERMADSRSYIGEGEPVEEQEPTQRTESLEAQEPLGEQGKSEEKPKNVKPGVLAGALAGATSLAAAATATTVGTSSSNDSSPENDNEDVETLVLSGEGGGSEVLHSKRMSISPPGPPDIVRTYPVKSTRSSHDVQPVEEDTYVEVAVADSRDVQPTETKPYHEEVQASSNGVLPVRSKSFPEDAQAANEEDDPEAIGVARTSNVPIPAAPTPPPGESVMNGHSAATILAQHGDENELERARRLEQRASRRPSVSPPMAHKTPSPAESAMMSERIVQRKELPQPRSASTPSRSPALASLRESDSWIDVTQENYVLENRITEIPRSRPQSSGQHGANSRSREIPVLDKASQRQSNDSTRSGTRSKSQNTESYPTERAALQRVSSTSSTTRSVSVANSALHSSKGSESSIGHPRGLSERLSEEDRQREFDSLVRGEETVKYTLTPQSMRDIDEPPVVKKVEAPKPTTLVTVYPRVDATQLPSTSSRQAQSAPQEVSARAVSKGKSSVTSQQTVTVSSTRPPQSNTKARKSGLAAREPRIQTESMRDFADFIRSTGPRDDRGPLPLQPFVTSATSVKPGAQTSPISGMGRKITGKDAPGPSSRSVNGTHDGPSTKVRPHMEPRSPAGPGNGNAELIDFIRQGPPNSLDGQHRISRTVAPFRTTVDSDEFNRMLDDRSPENSQLESAYSSQISTNSKQSNRTSTNSRTGLLPQQNVVQPAYSNTPQYLASNLTVPEPQVVRKRRRVKDPYAIDTDDEDEDLLTALPKSRRQEESLIDFLRNVEPPLQNDPKPLLANGAHAAANSRSRMINGSSHASSSANGSSSAPLATRSALPSSSGNPAVISSTITASAPKANKPKVQPRISGARDAYSPSTTDSNDLADFLRTSGPPEVRAPPANTAAKEEGKRTATRFWRRKTNVDMP